MNQSGIKSRVRENQLVDSNTGTGQLKWRLRVLLCSKQINNWSEEEQLDEEATSDAHTTSTPTTVVHPVLLLHPPRRRREQSVTRLTTGET